MADATTTAIARRCVELDGAGLPATVVEDARLRVVDALGCLVGGWDSPPARIARTLAGRQTATRPAHVLGSEFATTPEAAAFANAVATRYLDFNDTYMGVSAGHPSDMIPALLAVAEAEGASGEQLLIAVVTGYEAFGVIAKELSIRERGWDQGLLIGIGAAAGAGKLLGFDVAQMQEAIGLAVTMGVPTRSTRAGALTMWKGCATAASARLGLFSAALAAEGMTAPDQPLEGKHGLWEQVTGRFGVRPFGAPDPWIASSTAIKFFPCEFNAQAPLELLTQLRERVAAEDVANIDVWTYWSAYDEIGNEPAKWAPETRETADHSLPYLLAVHLLEGTITEASFDAAHLADPAIRALLPRIAVHEDPEFTAAWPGMLKTRLRITTRDGEVHEAASDHPPGHPKRPPTTADVEGKFLRVAAGGLGEAGAQAALATLAELPALPDAGALVGSFSRPVRETR